MFKMVKFIENSFQAPYIFYYVILKNAAPFFFPVSFSSGCVKSLNFIPTVIPDNSNSCHSNSCHANNMGIREKQFVYCSLCAM